MRRHLLVIIVTLSCIWLTGLIAFAAYTGAVREPESAAQTDAIVVLTGGSERVVTGAKLLQQGLGKKLFISGVAPEVDHEKLVTPLPLDPALKACCVVLGHLAGDTPGNAAESLEWLQREHYGSMRLVTSHYHMLRSLLEFRMLDDTVKIIPHPVAPAVVQMDNWWTRPGTARLLIIEYNKLLLAMFRTILHAFQAGSGKA